MRTVQDVIRDIVTTVPENWNHKEALTHAGVGAGIGGLLGFLLSGKKRRLRNTLIGAGALGLGGLGTYALKQNILEHTGGLYTKKRKGQLPVLPAVLKDLNAPGQHYVVYMPGAGEEKRPVPAEASKNTAVIPYGEIDTAVNFIDSLRPQDTVSLVGFSMGGGGALKAAERVKHPIQSMYTLDPVSADPLYAAKVKLFGWNKPNTVGMWKNIRPKDYTAKTIPNAFVRMNPLVLGDIAPESSNIHVKDDHSLWSTGLRIQEQQPAELQRLQQTLARLAVKSKASHMPRS